MGSATIGKDKAALHLQAIDEITLKAKVREVAVTGEEFEEAAKGKLPEQMEFTFEAQYSDIELRETIRGIKALTREIIRLGGNELLTRCTLDLLALKNETIHAAAKAMEDALAD